MNSDKLEISLLGPISNIEGISKKVTSILNKMNIFTKLDLLLHLPVNLTTVTYRNSLNQVNISEVSSIHVIIKDYKISSKSKFTKRPFQVTAVDNENNTLLINFFNYYSVTYLKKLLPLNSSKCITGKFEVYGKKLIINHPKVSDTTLSTRVIFKKERSYKTIQGITSKSISKYIKSILDKDYELTEWLDKSFFEKLQLPSFLQALRNIHLDNSFNIDTNDINLLRVALDEMLAFQLKLILAKSKEPFTLGYEFQDKKHLIKTLYSNLPFTLTKSQTEVINEIFSDLKSKKQMIRLLEGDVGSGKTIIALFSAILSVSSNYMVVVMVPTESLAKQHFSTFLTYTNKLGINIAILTGNTKSKERKLLIKKIANKQVDILIGTHATFQTDITFHTLGLIIIDEQHRFGVMQRLKLISKNKNPHVLMLSATPIPRTLALTSYGHISISRVVHKPQNRKPIITKALDSSKINNILERVTKKVLDKHKIFWICPLIQDNKQLNYTSTLVRYNTLLKYLPKNLVWLLHGQMDAVEKDDILLNFKSARQGILVSTTVIEVGIDIPDANIIIIEQAERFGLAQLHQLRGRVGRGNLKSYCLLIYSSNSSSSSKKRMEIMESSNDGFYIAEKDFELRGGGNVLGTQQSGETPFKIANFALQNKYMQDIVNYAKYLYTRQPDNFVKYCQLLDKIFHFDVKEFNFRDIFNNG